MRRFAVTDNEMNRTIFIASAKTAKVAILILPDTNHDGDNVSWEGKYSLRTVGVPDTEAGITFMRGIVGALQEELDSYE